MQSYCYFYFSGYYAAVAASAMLERHSVGSRVIKAPVSGRKGCRFAVVVNAEDGENAAAWMQRESAAYDSYEIVKK